MNSINCNSAVIAFIAAAVMHFSNPAMPKNGLVIFLSYKQKFLLHIRNCHKNKIIPCRYKLSKSCAPFCCGFVVRTNFSLIRTDGDADWSALQFVKVTDNLLPKTTESVMLRNE